MLSPSTSIRAKSDLPRLPRNLDVNSPSPCAGTGNLLTWIKWPRFKSAEFQRLGLVKAARLQRPWASRLILTRALGSRSRHSWRRYSADRPKPDGLGSAKRVHKPHCATRVGAH